MIKNISIPKPCQQAWQQMAVADNGKHCQSCCKTVVDFTTMTNDEIVTYLTTNQGTCGKFNGHQLELINNGLSTPKKIQFNWKGFIAVVSLITVSAYVKAEVKVQPTIELSPWVFKSNYDVALPDSNQLITIKGKLVDNDDKSPIAGATIRLKGTTTGTTTNINGEFKLEVPLSSSVIISFIGYQTQEFASVKFAGSKTQTVCVQAQSVMLGEPVVTYRKVPVYKRWFYKLKRMF